MAGAQKQRVKRERQSKKSGSSSEQKSKSSGPTTNSPTSHLSPPTRVDGNRDPSVTRSRSGSNASGSGAQVQVTTPQVNPNQVQNKNLDLGALAAFANAGYAAHRGLPTRPKQGNKTGREVNVRLNSFEVSQVPHNKVYQYDILIGSGAEKRGLIRAAWESKTVQDYFRQKQELWVFDGNRLAWSTGGPTNEARLNVDLDKERGREPKEGKKPDVIRVVFKRAKALDFSHLRSYLEGKAEWGVGVLEAINFLDHLLREEPSKKFTPIKRNFFARGSQRTPLGGGIEAFKGVYESVRPVSMGSGNAGRLAVNVDVANTAFWCEWPLHQTARDVCGARDVNHLAQMLSTFSGPKWDLMRRLRKLRVYLKHTKNPEESKKKPLIVDRILNKTIDKCTFEKRYPDGSKKMISVAQHFKELGIRIDNPHLPAVQMTKGQVLPMELCFVMENQRYMYKLGERQTSEMIKFAVTLPDVRWGHIKNGLDMLDWEKDRYLNGFGLRISSQPTQVKARVLPNPKVTFHQRSQGNPVDPKTSGRWDLRGKVFLEPHKTPLKSWGVCILTTGRFSATRQQVQQFLETFIGVFKGHGGQVLQDRPVIIESGDPAKAMEEIYNAAGNQAKQVPQLLVFIVPDKDSFVYQRIKKSCECRYGVVSQVMQSAHVQKCQQQYCSNVCMKVNAKLGGITTRATGMKGANSWFTKPTLVVGVDISHGAPGVVDAPSVAAITMSWDKQAIKYIAGVQTNGSRVDMVTSENIANVMGPMLDNWVKEVGNGRSPEHIIYVRDGAAEGQYPHVLHQEVSDMKRLVQSKNPQVKAAFTVIVATKRHHVRFFPEQGDRNKNPLPGTLVETGVTCPFEYDFYLCAHSAIKGTARPVHYHVLLDEANMKVEDLQNWIYESSYQFVRSTTPVSLFPAVYYADLAAGRAMAHLNQQSVSSGEDKTKTSSHSKDPVDIKPLLPMPPQNGIRTTMWYV